MVFPSSFERFAVEFREGQMIFCEFEPGEDFYLIQKGRIKIVKVFGDIEKTIDILHPGEIFGEMAILEDAPRSATTVALENCKLYKFNRSNFEHLMTGSPAIALKLLKLFVKRIHDQKRRLLILTLPDLDSRIADVFLMLAENQAIADTEEEDFGKRQFMVKPNDIAHWAGISEKDCRGILDRLVDQGRLEIYKDRLEVKNINELQRLVTSKRNNK